MEKFKIIRNVLQSETLELLKHALIISKDCNYFVTNTPLSDKSKFEFLVPQAYSWYGNHTTEGLLLSLKPLIEKHFDKELYPTYSYYRIYWKNSSLIKHKDKFECEYSVSVCVDCNDTNWPIFFDDVEVVLTPGDIVIYKGMEVEHWRELYNGTEQIQIFLHYVDKNGPYANLKFDRRPMLGLPLNFKNSKK
jgi:hypothetical protein